MGYLVLTIFTKQMIYTIFIILFIYTFFTFPFIFPLPLFTRCANAVTFRYCLFQTSSTAVNLYFSQNIFYCKTSYSMPCLTRFSINKKQTHFKKKKKKNHFKKKKKKKKKKS